MPCVNTWTVGFVLLSVEGIQNWVLILYLPLVVLYPVRTVLVKFLPCWVTFKTKSVASRFVCGTAKLNTACRAERSTGTVMLIHFLAAAEAAKIASTITEDEYMFGCLKSRIHQWASFYIYISCQYNAFRSYAGRYSSLIRLILHRSPRCTVIRRL